MYTKTENHDRPDVPIYDREPDYIRDEIRAKREFDFQVLGPYPEPRKIRVQPKWWKQSPEALALYNLAMKSIERFYGESKKET